MKKWTDDVAYGYTFWIDPTLYQMLLNIFVQPQPKL